jgi:signal transduction histidine kinase/ligand-binding sensor domain-containing protein
MWNPPNVVLRPFRQGRQYFPMPGCRMLRLVSGGAALLIWWAPASFGRGNPSYSFQSWRAEDGLRDNKIMAVVQTRDGYVWVGSYSGLARFDGIRFTNFDSDNTPEMHDSSVTSLFEAPDGTLWIGHATGDVTRYQNGHFSSVESHTHGNGGKIRAIGADECGDVWLLNVQGILTRVKDGTTLEPQGGIATNLLEMAVAPGGGIWVARSGFLSRLEDGRVAPVELPDDTAGNYIQGICASRDGGLWVANNQRLRKLKNCKWVGDLGRAPWGQTPLHAFVETKPGQLAAGTSDHGLYLITPIAGNAALPPATERGMAAQWSQFSRTNGLASDWVVSLCEDREGGLLIGTGSAGLFALRTKNVETAVPPDQWQGRAVLSVSIGSDETLWVGTEGAGLYAFRHGVWENFAKDAGIRNPYIWSVVEDTRGELWLGTWSGSLYQRQHDGTFRRATGVEDLAMPMPAVVPARSGGLWVGTGVGLMRYDRNSVEWFSREESNGSHHVCAVVEETNGTVWFGMHGGGLGCLTNGQVRLFRKEEGLSSDFIRCLHLGTDGALWIGTFGSGLNRLKDGRFARVRRENGLPDGVICDIEDDGQGFLWMSSYAGIFRMSKTELNGCADGKIQQITCKTYGLSDGLPTLQCSGGLQPAGCRSADGRLWFATSRGLVVVDPQNVQTNLLPPPVVLENLRVDGKNFGSGTDLTIQRSNGVTLRIPPGRHRFEFDFTGLSFVAPEKVRFKRRLEGLEPDWVSIGTKRAADYSYIPPGRYTFRVTACNNDGVWNEVGAALGFEVLPYFWQTPWFRVFAGAMTATAGGGIVWLGTRRRMRRRVEGLERQRAIEHERARIAHDIHDDLGAQLTRISMLSDSVRGEVAGPAEALGNLDRIYDTARDATRAMDEIVWAVNPKHDTLESLASYLEKFALDFLDAAGIRCRLDFPLTFPAWTLTTEVRHNVFLAFKEAFNNVARHAQASEVHVSLEVADAKFTVTVEDNGRGCFRGVEIHSSDSSIPADDATLHVAHAIPDPARIAGGNGLENMSRRLSEIGGRFEIKSTPRHGTMVRFEVPKAKKDRTL